MGAAIIDKPERHCSLSFFKFAKAKSFSVVIGEGKHPFPFRIRSLSPLPQMVLVSMKLGEYEAAEIYFVPPNSCFRKRALGGFFLSLRMSLRIMLQTAVT